MNAAIFLKHIETYSRILHALGATWAVKYVCICELIVDRISKPACGPIIGPTLPLDDYEFIGS